MSRNWQTWAAVARRALEPGPVVPHDQLLLMRDREGRVARQLSAPAGVNVRHGAVMLLLYPERNELRIPLTVRSDRLPQHRGEVSLPGGATDPDDTGAVATALRECHEELGLHPSQIQVWGMLSSLYIPPSNFQITPVVGFVAELPSLQHNPDEVSQVISLTLDELLDPGTVRTEWWNRRDAELLVPFFVVAGHKVWGATAIVLSEFAALLRRQLRSASPS